MKKKTEKNIKIITILFSIIVVVAFIISICKEGNHAPTRKEQEQLTYVAKWEMKYDRKHNLLKKELIYGEKPQKQCGLYYKYDKKGNRTELSIKDYAYQEDDEKITYEYKGTRMSAKIINDIRYEFSYKPLGDIVAETPEDPYPWGYRYKLTPTGKLAAEICVYHYEDKPDEEVVRKKCSYNIWGKIKSYTFCFDTLLPESKVTYTYKYDQWGRYYQIHYDVSSFLCTLPEDNQGITAEFVYKGFSKDCAAYTYNDEGEVVGKYEYKYNSRGDLTEVLIYENLSIRNDDDYDWGLLCTSIEYNYPGSEVPEGFYE